MILGLIFKIWHLPSQSARMPFLPGGRWQDDIADVSSKEEDFWGQMRWPRALNDNTVRKSLSDEESNLKPMNSFIHISSLVCLLSEHWVTEACFRQRSWHIENNIEPVLSLELVLQSGWELNFWIPWQKMSWKTLWLFLLIYLPTGYLYRPKMKILYVKSYGAVRKLTKYSVKKNLSFMPTFTELLFKIWDKIK